jgi:hypothetical protein
MVGVIVDPAADSVSHDVVDWRYYQADSYVRAYGVLVVGAIATGLNPPGMLAGLKHSTPPFPQCPLFYKVSVDAQSVGRDVNDNMTVMLCRV